MTSTKNEWDPYEEVRLFHTPRQEYAEAQAKANENPKNQAGRLKHSTHAIPPVAIFALGAAMQNGADKYGPFNFRQSDITASVFFDAMMRHLLLWWNGEDYASDSHVHHLSHLMASCAIILDGLQHGNFKDDRPSILGRETNLGIAHNNYIVKFPSEIQL